MLYLKKSTTGIILADLNNIWCCTQHYVTPPIRFQVFHIPTMQALINDLCDQSPARQLLTINTQQAI